MSELEETLEKKCSDRDKREKLQRLFDDFAEEVKDTINEIAYKTYGPFLPTLFAITAQLAAGAAMDYASFVTKVVTRNTVGGFISSVGLAVSGLNGSKTLLKYTAAKRLEKELNVRQQTSRALLREIRNLINILLSFKEMGITTDEALLGDVRRALLHVKKASLIVGREKSKIETSRLVEVTQNPVSPHRLRIAINHIDEALVAIGGQQLRSKNHEEELLKLNKKYSINIVPENDFTDTIDMVEPWSIVDFFRESTNNIKEKYTENGTLSDEGQKVLRYYIIDFIHTPGISHFFKTIASAQLLGGHMDTIGKKLPIRATQAASFAKRKAKNMGGFFDSLDEFNEEVNEGANDVFSYLKLQPYGSKIEFPDESPTLETTSFKIRSYETSILLIDDRFKSLQTHTGPLKKFLTPALSNLDDVRISMEEELYEGERVEDASDVASLTGKKIDWMFKLNLSKNLISTGIEAPVFLGDSKIPVSTYNVNKRFARSDEIFGDLQGFVRERLVDEEGNLIDSEAQQIIDIANRTLKSFALGPMSLLNPKARDNAISGLQSIRFLLREQITKDRREMGLARVYTQSVEANPLFSSVIKPA